MLRTRALSALVMIPVALGAVWLGSPFFDILVALAGAVMAWEWSRIVDGGRFAATGKVMAVVAVLAALLAAELPLLALLALAGGIGTVSALGRSRWLTLGMVYVGLPVVALVWLREYGGLMTLLWVFGLVWATDTGAYAAGRTIGGPLLAPRVSPKKTWAGLLGGMVAAALVGAGFALGLGLPVALLAGASAALAVVAQGGDLFESWIKRRYDVKDSSAIIPGHGGVLDRVDGLISAAPVVALAALLLGGGLEAWR